MVNELTEKSDFDQDFDNGWWKFVFSQESIARKVELGGKDFRHEASQKEDIDWSYAQNVFEKDEIVEMEVCGCNRGGVLVRTKKLKGFVPYSHLLIEDSQKNVGSRLKVLRNYVSNVLKLKIIELDSNKEKIVFSERAAQSDNGSRKKLISKLSPGEIVEGNISNVTDFGVFVDLGGLEGLIHISELSWKRVSHPSEVLEIGKKIKTQVISINPKNMHIALSYKRLYPNPWMTVTKRYRPGDIITGVITAILPYGFLAQIEEGIEGLIHHSSFKPKSIEEILDEKNLGEGDEVQVRIIYIDEKNCRMSLALVF